MIRKIIFYQKGSSKPIVLTDESDIPEDQFIKSLTETVFTSDKIITIKTK
jgi:hypothetical protein